ncbi:MAG TPA: CAP domain-containing protein [Solirubrobacteraceae bacterium]|nr:CAP domain-containing protein [Solirubrobacteraceae bacterium]
MTCPSVRRLLTSAVATCALFAVPGAATAAAAPCANADLMPTAANGPQVRGATLCLLNRERTSRGLSRLRHDGQLRKVAQGYSREMVRQRFFDHVGRDGSTLTGRVRGRTTYLRSVASWSLGENLYWGTGERGTPRESVDGWMHSPGHRHNILNPGFRDIGIGIAIGAPEDVDGEPAATYTTEFGTRTSR